MSEGLVRQLALLVPAGLPAEAGILVAALEDGRRRTKELVATLDRATLDWTASEAGNSIGTLLYHIAACELAPLGVRRIRARSHPRVSSCD